MKFTSIWAPNWGQGYTLAERLRRTRELWYMNVAGWLPRRLVFWVYARTSSKYTKDHEIVTDVRYMEIVERLGKDVDRLA